MVQINLSGIIDTEERSIHFSCERKGWIFPEIKRITYSSGNKELKTETITSLQTYWNTKNLTSSDEDKFYEKLQSSKFFDMEDKYPPAEGSADVRTFTLFVFIVSPIIITGTAANSIKSVTWSDGSSAPKSLVDLAEYIESL